MSSAKPNDDKREKLPMEQKFDQWVYGGISYAAQAVAGSLATYWVKHGGGKKVFDNLSNQVGEGFVSKVSAYKGARAAEVANGWLTVVALVMVGNLFVAPVKWFEDKKAKIVEKWTADDNKAREARGEVITPDEKQHQDALLEQLKNAPKQTWWSLGVGRLASLVPVFAGLNIFRGANKHMEAAFQKLAKGTANAVGLKKVASSEVYHNASGIVFYDGFYSMLSAGGLYIYSHFIAPPKKAAQDEPLLKEIIAPETSLETIPEQHKSFAERSHKSNHQSHVAALNAETTNLQVAL